MFKSFTNNSSIHVLILTVSTLWMKGNIKKEKNDLRNALSCYTEAIEVKCKNDGINFCLYLMRSRIHYILGEFRLHYLFFVLGY